MLKRLLLLPLWPLARPGSDFKLSDEKEESNLSTPCYKSSSLTRVQIIMLVVAMWCLYPTTELLKKKKKKKKQKQLPYFRANFVWAIIWSVLQTTLILTATHRQVSGSPTSGWSVPAVACPESCGKYSGNTHSPTLQLLSSHDPFHVTTLNSCSVFPFRTSLCVKLNRFFFLIKIMQLSYITVHLQNTNKSETSVSFYY